MIIAHSGHELNIWLSTVARSLLQGFGADPSPHHSARCHGCFKSFCSCRSGGPGARDPPRSHTSWTHPQTCCYSRLCGVSITMIVTLFRKYIAVLRHRGLGASHYSPSYLTFKLILLKRFSKMFWMKDNLPKCVIICPLQIQLPF